MQTERVHPAFAPAIAIASGRVEPHVKYRAHRPIKGQPLVYRGQPSGVIDRVETSIAYFRKPDGNVDSFIWCFGDIGLNTMHDWPTKTAPRDLGAEDDAA